MSPVHHPHCGYMQIPRKKCGCSAGAKKRNPDLDKLVGDWIPSDKSIVLPFIGAKLVGARSELFSGGQHGTLGKLVLRFSNGRELYFQSGSDDSLYFASMKTPQDVPKVIVGKHVSGGKVLNIRYRVTEDLGNGNVRAVVEEVKVTRKRRAKK